MISRYEVCLNGISLESISEDIVVLDVHYSSPAFQDETVSIVKRDGARFLNRKIDSASVSISFEIHSYPIRQRQAICNAVCAWAKDGGILTINDRQDQFLKCICSQFPIIESVRNWTDPLTVEFTAYIIPYWQDKNLHTLSLTGTAETGSLWIPGSVNNIVVEADVLANAGLTSVSLTANDRTISLSGLSVASGKTIVLSYDSEMIQQIKVDSTSLLNKRSGADDLLVDCAKLNSLSFEADASATVTFKVRGGWL